MTQESLLSVIIPCYNIEKYVAKTVCSVLEQTYRQLEIWLVDDGSTDTTPQILDDIAKEDERIHVIHKTNGGVTSARLAGIAAATGEWIGFVDGDDYIEPTMYERLLANAYQNQADISHCGYQMVFPSRVDYYHNTGRCIVQDTETGLNDLLQGKFVEPCLCNKLFRAALFEGMEMDTSIHYNEDLLMNYFLFKKSKKSVFEDICPYHYLLRGNSATSSKVSRSKMLDPLAVLKIMQADLGDSPLKRIVEQRIIGQWIHLSTYPLRGNRELVKPIRATARKELRKSFWRILQGGYARTTKLHALWCAIWPWSYSAVHTAYSIVKGTRHKYDIV